MVFLSVGLYAPVPGLRQTVPRAELHAILLVATLTKDTPEPVTVATDALGVYQTFGRPALWSEHENADLWIALRRTLQGRAAPFYLRWTKSHAINNAKFRRDYDIGWADIVANEAADALAGLGAELNAMLAGEADAYKGCAPTRS